MPIIILAALIGCIWTLCVQWARTQVSYNTLNMLLRKITSDGKNQVKHLNNCNVFSWVSISFVSIQLNYFSLV